MHCEIVQQKMCWIYAESCSEINKLDTFENWLLSSPFLIIHSVPDTKGKKKDRK